MSRVLAGDISNFAGRRRDTSESARVLINDRDDSEFENGWPSIVWLDSIIRSLPDGYRQAVEMAELEERSQQEVADRLGLSLSAAKSRMQRGRAIWKDALEQGSSFELDGRGRLMGCNLKSTQQVCRGCGD